MTSLSRRRQTLRIGCASGFWGDSEAGAIQLVASGQLHYLVFDFLAEITMSLLARAKAKSSEAGYAPDFVRIMMGLAPEIQRQGIRVVANAGGVNPNACAAALRHGLNELGISLRIAVVDGDDLTNQLEALRAEGLREMFSGELLPEKMLSANAYLGAQPIAAALRAGADIVITGRVVDSAVTLGPLVHEFGWSWRDWDKLACGSLAGHIIECGTQCTGGLFTDWEQVPGWDNMGFPIVECDAEGQQFVVTKPAGTGGLITPATVAEQIVYEIGDPACYALPDVRADFRHVTLRQDGVDRVIVSGARGKVAPELYKASLTYSEGWRLMGTLMIGGHQAVPKAWRVGENILKRVQRFCHQREWGDFSQTSLEVLGAESTYGPYARGQNSREVILKIAAKHSRKEALELLAKEIAPSATSMAQGITGFAAGRPSPSPVVRLFSCLINSERLTQRVYVDEQDIGFVPERVGASDVDDASKQADTITTTAASLDAQLVKARLLQLAYARSGDKGDTANIGLIARSKAAYEVLRHQVTKDKVYDYFSHLVNGQVFRYELPGFQALNFVMTQALGGGGVTSLRYDPQGKAFAQMLLDMEIDVPVNVLEEISCDQP